MLALTIKFESSLFPNLYYSDECNIIRECSFPSIENKYISNQKMISKRSLGNETFNGFVMLLNKSNLFVSYKFYVAFEFYFFPFEAFYFDIKDHLLIAYL